MNSEEAKQLLEVYRPGSADATDPRFAEVLDQVQRDPELSQWLKAQNKFDALMTEGLKTIEAPADLKASILASQRVVRVPLWRETRVRVAMAACAVGLAVLGTSLFGQRAPRFPEFREELVAKAWNGDAHLDFKSSDLVRIRQWLAREQAVPDLSLPSGLRDARVHGCRMVQVDGHRVPMICLSEGSRHLHLFVVEGTMFANLPPAESPDFQKCGAWKTTSWQQGEKTFVLTGLKYQTFVSKFRKMGRWDFSG
jgi:hypothetical protein